MFKAMLIELNLSGNLSLPANFIAFMPLLFTFEHVQTYFSE
jgi:hypothetical protein